MKKLLERNDVNPDTPDRRGRTPFLWAIIYGHNEVMEILQEQNKINPDADESGHTPLSWAVTGEWNRIGLVETLLKRSDVNPHRADSCGRTPLSFAAEYGYINGVEILLKRSDVNPGRADKTG